MTEPVALGVMIGIDWSDKHHDVSLEVAGTGRVENRKIVHSPSAIADWVADLRKRFPDQTVGIALETSRGPLVHALLDHDFIVLYPVNPRSLKRFREAFAPSGAKDDMPDAKLLREMLVKHRDRLRPWLPEDEGTRALSRLVQSRRKAVDMRTKLTQQLTAALKEYYPQALHWAGDDLTSTLACDFLLAWPSLTALKRVRPATIRRFYHEHNSRSRLLIEKRLEEIRTAVPLTLDPAIVETSVLMVQLLARQLKALGPSIDDLDEEIAQRFALHADADLFSTLPGSGAALAPRLLAVFGSDRTRFPSAADVQQYSGIAPVTERSGQRSQVHWRWAVPVFVRQTFHEFAHHSIQQSEWAKAYYALQRHRGKGHQAAVRALAFKWIRVIWACWMNRTPYDEARYTRALIQRASPLALELNAARP